MRLTATCVFQNVFDYEVDSDEEWEEEEPGESLSDSNVSAFHMRVHVRSNWHVPGEYSLINTSQGSFLQLNAACNVFTRFSLIMYE